MDNITVEDMAYEYKEELGSLFKNDSQPRLPQHTVTSRSEIYEQE